MFKSFTLFFFSLLSLGVYAEATIPVHFIILQNSNGVGNELWVKDDSYLMNVMNKVNNYYYVTKEAELVFASKRVIKDTRDYNSPMSDGSHTLIKKYDNLEKKGSIIVVIAREEKVDVNGRAKQQGETFKPVFIMRTVVNGKDPKATDFVGGDYSAQVTASLFVHEMGHMIGFNHATRVKGEANTENYTFVASARKKWESYLAKLASYNPQTAAPIISAPRPVISAPNTLRDSRNPYVRIK